VYGLAEATLVVTSGRRAYEPSIRSVDRDALAGGALEPVAEGRELVASGPFGFGTDVAIVDPETRRRCAAGRVGEIWVSSPSVARGYWRRPAETAATFEAVIAGEPDRRYLRTGDLGALVDGELFVVGRIKDMLIVRGVKYFPQDIELTIEQEHGEVRPGGVAAYALCDDAVERVGVVVEIDQRRLKLHSDPTSALESMISGIREAVLSSHGLALHDVALVAPGQVPKTSSGKVRRLACAAAAATGELPVLRRWSQDASHGRHPAGESAEPLVLRTGT
jgi:acyl-CoA synthetase (AMP-forming)/AMP-acid ligase II